MSVALLWRAGDGEPPESTRNYGRLRAVFDALANLGIKGEPVLYRDGSHNAVRDQLLRHDGVLVWVDPVSGGEDRSQLNVLLREVADRGVWVSAHPDTIDKIGTKEVLYTTRHLGWGSDTRRYASPTELARDFARRLMSGARVLKLDRSNGGLGVWKVSFVDGDGTESAASHRVRVQHAAPRDQVTHEMPLAEFLQGFDGWFVDGGVLIDQPFVPRIREGMVRAYLVVDAVAGFARQRPEEATPTGDVLGLPSAKSMSVAADPALRALRRSLESEWVPSLCDTLGLSSVDLPLLWDVDFLYGPKTAGGEDTYVLCEINVSSVLPFPDDVPGLLARAVGRRLNLT